jgi:hypothetical protein
MFDKNKLANMLALDRDSLMTSEDNLWVIYKLNFVDKLEFRVEKNTETIHRFFLEKNDTIYDRLITYLKSLGLVGEN